MKSAFIILAICMMIMFGCKSNSSSDKNQNIQKETNINTNNATENTTITIDKETVKDCYCNIINIFENNNKFYITVDYVNFLTGEEAEKAAKSKGMDVYNDYFLVNDNPKLRTFEVSENVNIKIIDYTDGINPIEINMKDFKEKFSPAVLFIIAVNDGILTNVEEPYMP